MVLFVAELIISDVISSNGILSNKYIRPCPTDTNIVLKIKINNRTKRAMIAFIVSVRFYGQRNTTSSFQKNASLKHSLFGYVQREKITHMIIVLITTVTTWHTPQIHNEFCGS